MPKSKAITKLPDPHAPNHFAEQVRREISGRTMALGRTAAMRSMLRMCGIKADHSPQAVTGGHHADPAEGVDYPSHGGQDGLRPR